MPQYTWYAKIRSTLLKRTDGISSHHTLYSQHTVQNAFASGNVDYSLENNYLGYVLFFFFFHSSISTNRPGQVCDVLFVSSRVVQTYFVSCETLEKNSSNTEAWLNFWMVTKGPTVEMLSTILRKFRWRLDLI